MFVPFLSIECKISVKRIGSVFFYMSADRYRDDRLYSLAFNILRRVRNFQRRHTSAYYEIGGHRWAKSLNKN